MQATYIATMSFAVRAEDYDRFMGRYSTLLAPRFADFAGIAKGQRALDVGCGPGALTSELAHRLGSAAVVAVDPSESFIAATRDRNPGVAVQRASAEQLPFADAEFDRTLAQLVVHFMAEPVSGLREMARVTRSDGVIAACVWDHAGGHGPLSTLWDSARELAHDVIDESCLPGAREGHLGELLAAAGLRQIRESALEVSVEHPSFEDWWEPYTLGVGPAGAYVASLDEGPRATLRELCRERLADPPFVVAARAWGAAGIA